MPLTQEKSTILKPSHLFQISDTDETILVTNSDKQFWIKDRNWQAVQVDEVEHFRDGGTVIFYFNYSSKVSEKIYTKIFIPTPLPSKYENSKLPYIEQKTSLGGYLSKDLKEILLSKKKLDEIGITQHLKLDVTNMPESHTPEQNKVHVAKQNAKQLKCSTQFFKKTNDDFFEALFSKAETSSSGKTNHSGK